MEGGPVTDPVQVVVAIDGPSGSGKSTVSKEIARRLDLGYLDTGAMYRAVAWWALDQGVDLSDPAAVVDAARNAPVEISTDPDHQTVQVGETDVTDAIRTPEVTSHVSSVATVPAAREVLVDRQRQVIEDSGRRIVAEGRDITTVVAPDADVRILLVASEQARMNRRGAQLGGSQNAEALRQQVVGRDAKDSTVVNFSTAADGVTTLDNSELNLEQSVQAVMDLVLRAVPELA
ncbi:(d)CMP kinase [Kocuria sp. JC486]|uniref:(d)CMP kinase n=1 Tax=Kocuria sp. JC486 TaxID=1970736 RepID=UPI00141DDE9E|nr:(d)CMP kinase [Kocuria sp. JC486]NHU85913.1 (d)CMP kinase [Kocuria sp. JC486]